MRDAVRAGGRMEQDGKAGCSKIAAGWSRTERLDAAK